MNLQEYEPKNVFSYFTKISQTVPRISLQEENISNMIKQFATQLDLDVKQDKDYNIVIKKPATNSHSTKTVMLQAHLDMVTEKDIHSSHNFSTDAIEFVLKEGWVWAKNTTLGADNGIGVAMIMAILADKTISHPVLEVIFTTAEEIGLIGIMNFDPTPYHFQAQYLINIDNSTEGVVGVSSLGGCRSDLEIPVGKVPINPTLSYYKLAIEGLKGGHSGANIDDGLANAHKLLGRVLSAVIHKVPLYIENLYGGNAENAIPRDSYAHILFDEKHLELLQNLIQEFNNTVIHEYLLTDPHIKIYLEKINGIATQMLSEKSTYQAIDILEAYPNGVITKNFQLEKIPQTSLSLGIISVTGAVLKLSSGVRSSIDSELQWLLAQLDSLARLAGGTFTVRNSYPVWEYKNNSELCILAKNTAQEFFGHTAKEKSMLGGTEVGILKKYAGGDIDSISIGPNILDLHTTTERMEIESVNKTYRWLVKILDSL